MLVLVPLLRASMLPERDQDEAAPSPGEEVGAQCSKVLSVSIRLVLVRERHRLRPRRDATAPRDARVGFMEEGEERS